MNVTLFKYSHVFSSNCMSGWSKTPDSRLYFGKFVAPEMGVLLLHFRGGILLYNFILENSAKHSP